MNREYLARICNTFSSLIEIFRVESEKMTAQGYRVLSIFHEEINSYGNN